MLKLVKSLLVIITFVSSFASFAGLITPNTSSLAQNSYVTYGGYDWTWASTFNVQFYFCDPKSDDNTINYDDYLSTVYSGNACANTFSNQLMSVGYHQGWSFFEDLLPNSGTTLSVYLESFLTANKTSVLDLFTDTNGNKIQSFGYWNTSINTTSAFNAAFVSDWRTKTRAAVSPFTDPSAFANTIYVRKTQTSNPVPEPATILIFAIALLALSVRSRKQA